MFAGPRTGFGLVHLLSVPRNEVNTSLPWLSDARTYLRIMVRASRAPVIADGAGREIEEPRVGKAQQRAAGSV